MHIGIIGSGQLARMQAQAGQKLGHSFAFLAPSEAGAAPVQGLGDIVIAEQGMPTATLYEKLGKPEVITVESEQVDCDLLDALAAFAPVHPNTKALRIFQHRRREKQFFIDNDLATVAVRFADKADDVKQAVAELGGRVVIKSCEEGYDGKNQWRVSPEKGWQQFVDSFTDGTEVVIEQMVSFTDEVSLIASRSITGDISYYPLTKNHHTNGILLTSTVVTEPELLPFTDIAQSYLSKMMNELDYVGTMAMECFIVDGKLLINEIAPRVHNSGHWTMDGCKASQFENHIRAISGDALGDTSVTQMTGMLNLLGTAVSDEQVSDPAMHLYWYQKTVRPGRKVGHVNITGTDNEEIQQKLQLLQQQVYPQ